MNRLQKQQYKLEISLCKKLGRAIQQYNMIQDGDKILLGYSGGKDSITLLNLLEFYHRISKEKFEIIVIHIESNLAPKENKKKIIKDLKAKKHEYIIQKMDIKLKDTEKNCFWCSWNRRKQIFLLAQKLECNKVALAHHKNDFSETALLNLFYQARCYTMDPCQEFFKGKFSLIRPMMYIEEKETISYMKKRNLTAVTCNCPSHVDSNRKDMKKLLEDLDKTNGKVLSNVLQAGLMCHHTSQSL